MFCRRVVGTLQGFGVYTSTSWSGVPGSVCEILVVYKEEYLLFTIRWQREPNLCPEKHEMRLDTVCGWRRTTGGLGSQLLFLGAL